MRQSPQTRTHMQQARALVQRLLAAGKRKWVAPVAVLLLILAVIAGAIIVSSVTQQHVQLDDGTVWVTSLQHRKAARFNVKLKQADAAISSPAQKFDVAQHDSDTLLYEGSKASCIKASTISVNGSAETGGNAVTMIGGGTAAFLNTKNGNVWAGKAGDAASISPASAQPKMKLGTGGLAVVDSDGEVWGYRPSDGMVLKLANPTDTRAVETKSITGGERLEASSFTVVSGTPVVVSGKRLVFKGGEVSLDVDGRLVLQSPAVDGEQSGWVAVASPSGLITVNLNEANPKPFALTSGGKGEPAQPVSSGGCVHAAFSQNANNYVRVCSVRDTEAEYNTLKQVNASSQLVLRANHRQVILNDVINGNVWNPKDSTNVIKIQWNTIQTEQREQEQLNNDSASNRRDFAKTCSTQSGQIKAQDDDFGARVGSRQILDVLRNDEQTDCSVLRITRANAPAGGNVSVWPIYDGRYLQFDASNAHAGSASFSYEISDGHGQSSTATVHVSLTDGANRAPTQSDMPPEVSLEQGATYTMNALGSFTDPDGDPLTLVSATANNSDQVTITTRADGQLVFNAGAATSGRIGVEVTASDGEAVGTGMAYFSIKPANTLAADIDPVVTSTLPDTDTTIELKQYVHGTSAQPAQLSSVEPPSGTRTTMNAADMTIQFTATQTGTYYVPYTITQGSMPATGLARVEVQPSAKESSKPIASNDVALLGSDNTAIVEPLNNDIDPMGGVLSITSVSAEASSGIKTGLVGHKRVYLMARQTPTKPVKVSYTVANAVGTATGTITLQPPALSATNSVPKAGNVNAQVRTGGIVSVDVLDHVNYSDGTTVKLCSDLQTDKATFKGLAFVSGNTVRYQAPDEPGVYPITYTVKDNLGNAASGTITVTVHKKNAEGKAAPTPHDVEAQVAAGQKVRIPITLTGIDADGDDDQLLGLGNKAPQLGRITEVGADYLIYEAYEDSSGTDTFSYAVEDWTGQRAQARICVGVFQGTSDSGVVARDDSVTLRPNTAATVPVALNDICGYNAELSVEKKLETQGIDSAEVRDNMVSFTAPSQPGTSYIIYTIKDKAGLQDTGTLTVNVDPNAPIEAPDAYDYRVPSAATIDKTSVDVDVSQWIANPSGTSDELEVGVDSSAKDHARVKGGNHSTVITVDLTDEARAVPYTVTNTTHGLTSTAFIQVPAYGVFPPALRPKAPALKVGAGGTIEIDIADYVRVGAGKTPYVDGADGVSATKAANGDLYVDEGRLKFTAAKDYAGPASITFTAADGKRGKDKATIINTAVLTLPITVVGRDVPAPTFSSPVIDVAAGEEATTIDLKALTHSPNEAYEDDKEYTYSGGGTSGKITASVSTAGLMLVKAEQNASPGTTVNVPVQITYAKGSLNAGVSVRVVASSRPLARVGDKTVKLKAGTSETVNLFDGAYNPFPETPLRAAKCASDDNSKLLVVCDASGSITISAAKNIGASSNRVIATVEDGTGAEDRKVTGAITVSVVDRPEAPLLSPVDAKARDGAVDLAWTPNSANGSPITEYEVTYSGPSAGTKSCGAATTCKVTDLTNGQTYTFTVRAKNEVGWSQYSNATTGKPDKVPGAPGDVSVMGGKNALTVNWQAPQGKFSAPTGYNVTIIGPNGWTDRHTGVTGTSDRFDISDNVLSTGTSFTANVTAINEVGESAAGTGSGGDVYGKPDDLTLSLHQDGDTVTGTVQTHAMRGNSCQVLTADRSEADGLDCDTKRFSFSLNNDDFFTDITVTVTMTTDQGIKVSGKQSIQPHAAIGTVGFDAPDANDDKCEMSWHIDGKVDEVEAELGGNTSEAHTGRLEYTPQPWTVCAIGTVTPKLNGVSASPSSSPQDSTMLKPKAAIEQPTSATWVDRDHIAIEGTYPNAYGRDVNVSVEINGEAFSWRNGETIDVSGLANADSYTLQQITVSDAKGDTALDNSQDCRITISGTRPITANAGGHYASARLLSRITEQQIWTEGRDARDGAATLLAATTSTADSRQNTRQRQRS
ncbi:Ig-like domain-containing protein [Bifidobacterium panos]|uniref:ATPase AAA n=1 Tax=Bifidobacterium panos TaxID=2675321 RepID=A0ABX1SYY8_9BIFI|nr:Ig-like domain-containing protein [Bifidobacterium sp. DSM 109963]NMN01628.1 ATPase AAA [Bifidobacterium sp. DSM 109963]